MWWYSSSEGRSMCLQIIHFNYLPRNQIWKRMVKIRDFMLKSRKQLPTGWTICCFSVWATMQWCVWARIESGRKIYQFSMSIECLLSPCTYTHTYWPSESMHFKNSIAVRLLVVHVCNRVQYTHIIWALIVDIYVYIYENILCMHTSIFSKTKQHSWGHQLPQGYNFFPCSIYLYFFRVCVICFWSIHCKSVHKTIAYTHTHIHICPAIAVRAIASPR